MPRNLPWAKQPSSNHPVLRQQDSNNKAAAKRGAETIDLTNSDDEGGQIAKTPRLSQEQYPTPALSSSHGQQSGTHLGQSSQSTPSRAQLRSSHSPQKGEFSRPPSLNAEYSSSYSPSWGPSRTDATHSQAERDAWLASSQSQRHADENDVYETIASSQDVSIGSEDFVKYSELPTKIVGVRYYRGITHQG